MKKIFIIITFLFISILFVSCDKNNNKKKEEPSSTLSNIIIDDIPEETTVLKHELGNVVDYSISENNNQCSISTNIIDSTKTATNYLIELSGISEDKIETIAIDNLVWSKVKLSVASYEEIVIYAINIDNKIYVVKSAIVENGSICQDMISKLPTLIKIDQ